MTVEVDHDDEQAFLDTVDGEISFFRSIMRARPVGLHKHFHLLAIRSAIGKDTGHWVHVDTLWKKLGDCYDLDALEAIDLEADAYAPATDSPAPSENLTAHPYFREEFVLPYDDYDSIISQRRLRQTVSAPSSPAASPAASQGATAGPSTSAQGTKRPASRKRAKAKSNKYAGLVAGDSDSSALTQESGDEGAGAANPPGTPRESVMTGTDAGTEYGDEEDTEMREPSPAQEASPKPGRGRPSKGGRRGRGISTPRAATTRSNKKRKR